MPVISNSLGLFTIFFLRAREATGFVDPIARSPDIRPLFEFFDRGYQTVEFMDNSQLKISKDLIETYHLILNNY
jgi:hypothetical protein